MASTLLETLNNIENGRKHCISEAKKVGYQATDNMSVYDIGNLFSQTPTGEAVDGWQRPEDWWDCETILANAEERDGLYPAYILLLADWDKETTFSKNVSSKSTQGDGFLTSDGVWYVGDTTHTWDTTKDKPCSEGYKTRYVIVYVADKNNLGTIYLKDFNFLGIFVGDILASGFITSPSNVNNTHGITSFVCSSNTKFKENIILNLSYCYSLKEIFVPNLKTGDVNFNGCRSLENIFLPLLEVASKGIFFGCYSLKNASLPSLKTVNANQIADYGLFASCHSLKNVSLPALANVNLRPNGTDNNGLFADCYSLRMISMPALKNLGGCKTFHECYSLQSFTFFSTYETFSMTTIFEKCQSLKTINLYNDWSQSGLSAKDCPLTRPCLLDMLDKLKDVTNEESAFTLTLGATNIAKLTEEEIAVGTNKGWVIN